MRSTRRCSTICMLEFRFSAVILLSSEISSLSLLVETDFHPPPPSILPLSSLSPPFPLLSLLPLSPHPSLLLPLSSLSLHIPLSSSLSPPSLLPLSSLSPPLSPLSFTQFNSTVWQLQGVGGCGDGVHWLSMSAHRTVAGLSQCLLRWLPQGQENGLHPQLTGRQTFTLTFDLQWCVSLLLLAQAFNQATVFPFTSFTEYNVWFYGAIYWGVLYECVDVSVNECLLQNFYREIDKEELYIRYIYRLAELHERDQSYTEAGFTLLLHAKGLEVHVAHKCSAISKSLCILSVNYFVYCQYITYILSVHYLYTVSKLHCILPHKRTHSGQVRKSKLLVTIWTRQLANGRSTSTMMPSSCLTRARCGSVVSHSARSWQGSTRPSCLTTTSWPPSWSVAMVTCCKVV